jgi:integrase
MPRPGDPYANAFIAEHMKCWRMIHDRQGQAEPLDLESVAKVFDRRVAKSGLPRIRFHDLRHTHVAHLIAAGEQPLLIARRLGHASSSFTMDCYGHLFEDPGSQAASAVAAMIDGA